MLSLLVAVVMYTPHFSCSVDEKIAMECKERRVLRLYVVVPSSGVVRRALNEEGAF